MTITLDKAAKLAGVSAKNIKSEHDLLEKIEAFFIAANAKKKADKVKKVFGPLLLAYFKIKTNENDKQFKVGKYIVKLAGMQASPPILITQDMVGKTIGGRVASEWVEVEIEE